MEWCAERSKARRLDAESFFFQLTSIQRVHIDHTHPVFNAIEDAPSRFMV